MNGDVDAYNVEEICRLCLKAEGTILPIFGLEHSSRDCIPLSNKIKACVAVEVDRNDELLPKKICVGCVHQVDSWHKFKTACDTAQTKLTSWIKTTERYKSATSEIIIKQEPIDDFECDDVIICDDDSNDTAAPPSPPPIFENPRIDAPESASVVENQDHHEDSNISFFDANARDPLEITPEQSNDAENVGSNVEEPPIHGKSLLEQALEGDVVDKPPRQLDEDELMIADFSDELAPDLKLLKGDDVVTQDGVESDHEVEGLVDENSVASTGCVVKTEEASLIHMIDFEMKRRASEDFDTVEPFVDVGDEDDYEDYDVGIVVEGSHSQQKDVELVGMVTRSSRRFDDADVTAGKSENGMMIEAFSLKDDFGGERFEGDPFSEEHERLLNGTAGSNVDPDAMTVNSSITQSDATSMIVKQEPMSPGTVDDYEVSSMSKDDWATDEPTADVDYKPEVDQLNHKKKRKYRRHSYKKGRVPCKPCGGTYPNYLKYIRHCKSLKHQNNVQIFKSLGKPVPEEPILGPPVTPPKLDNVKPHSVSIQNGVEYHVCPIMSCSKSFKHRRNLQSHVKLNHGFNLKELERSERRPEPIDESYTPPEQSHPPPEKQPRLETESLEPEINSGEKQTVFTCNVCSKEFGYRRSLNQHLFIFHNVTPPTPRLKCPRCLKNFQKMTGLKSHLRSCGVFLNSKRCPYCLKDHATYKENYRHKAVCPKRYARVEKSNQAARIVVPRSGSFTCRFCDVMFDERSTYTDHMETYHAGEPVDVEEETIESEEPIDNVNTTADSVTINVNSGEVPCKFCFKSFPTITELNKHVQEHQYSKSFECKICKQVLTTMRNFHDHMRSHFVTHSKQYLCWTCYTPFNNRSALGAHKKLHENITMRIYTCTVCKHSFHDSISLARHKKTHFYGFESNPALDPVESKRDILKTIENSEREAGSKQEASLLCQVCKKEFSTQEALDKHSRLHKPVNSEVIKKFVQNCSTCNRTFKSRLELRNHVPYCKPIDGEVQTNVPMPSFKKSLYSKMAHSHQRVQCDKCGSSFAKAIGLKKHISMNRCPLVRHDYDKVQKTFKCRYCKKKLATIVGLYKHLNSCKVFISKYGKNYHSDQCPTCHKKFSSFGVLYNHARFCSGSSTAISKLIKQEPGVYKTCKNCLEKFDTDELFEEHVNVCKVSESDETIKKYCTYCDLRFDDLPSYNMHKKYCSKGEAPTSSLNSTSSFRCEGCSAVFLTQDRLKSHLKTCKFYRQTPVVMLTKQTVLEQCKCGVVFTSRTALDAHKENCATAKESSAATTTTIDITGETSDNVPKKIWECQYCRKKFDKHFVHNSHMRICKVKLRQLQRKSAVQNQPPQPTRPARQSRPPPSASNSSPLPTNLPPPPPMIPLSSLTSSSMSSSPSFTCPGCSSIFATESDLIMHSCSSHQQPQPSSSKSEPVEIMVEPDNPLNFNDLSDFGFHYMDDISQREMPQNLLKCFPCDKVFSSSVTLNKHRSLFHPNESNETYLIKSDGTVQCPKCPRSFKDQKGMAHHMGWHTRMEDSPGQQQTTSPQQVINPNIFMQTPPFMASATSSPNVPPYVEHKTPYSCMYCSRAFTGKGQLQNHLKTHTHELPYPQTATSGDGDTQKPTSTTLTYRCRFCSKRFRDKAVMLEHQNLHKTILAAASSTTSVPNKPKPAAEPKYLVSCNLCHKTLSSSSVAKHKKMHEVKGNVRLNISTLFTAINKPAPSNPNSNPNPSNDLQQQMQQYQQQYHQQQQQLQQQQQQQLQQYQQQIQQQHPPQNMVPCPVCYRLFSGQRSLTDHISTEHAGFSKLDVVEIDDDDDDDQYNSHHQSNDMAQNYMDVGGVSYKCEICNLAWQHKSEYLQHVNDPSHRELTKRLSAILNRVNSDLVIS